MKYKTRFFLFFVTLILFHLAANFAHPVTPTIIHDLNLPEYMFGLALAMTTGTNFLFSPFWGKINPYFSSRRSLLLSGVGYGIAQLGFAYSTTMTTILFFRMLAGIFVGGAFVSFLTYVVNMAKPEDQGKFLTALATIHSVAGAFGYLIGGVIGEFSIIATFLAQAGSLIASGILFYLICLPDNQQKEPISPIQLLKTANPLQAICDGKYFMNPGFALLFCLCVLANFANTGFDQAFNYYLKDQLHLTSSYNGIIKAAVGMVSFVFNTTLCVWIIQKTDVRKSLVVLMGVCTLSAAAAIVTPNILLFITWSVLVYAGYSVSIPVLQDRIAGMADGTQKSLVMGFYNSTKSLGSVIGSLTAGFIYTIHVKLPFLLVALAYGLGIIITLSYWLYTVRHPRKS